MEWSGRWPKNPQTLRNAGCNKCSHDKWFIRQWGEESGAHQRNQTPVMKENTFKPIQSLDAFPCMILDKWMQTGLNKQVVWTHTLVLCHVICIFVMWVFKNAVCRRNKHSHLEVNKISRVVVMNPATMTTGMNKTNKSWDDPDNAVMSWWVIHWSHSGHCQTDGLNGPNKCEVPHPAFLYFFPSMFWGLNVLY